MKKKKITMYGVVELSDGYEERFAETVLSGNNGSVYLLDAERLKEDIFDWVDTYVKLVGWRYRDDGHTFIEVTELSEVEDEMTDQPDSTDYEGLAYLDEEELAQLGSWERD